MNLLLIRDTFGNATLGKLFRDGATQCETLEDRDRKLEDGGVKVPKETAIPRGTYTVILSYSNRFNRTLPLLLNVPGFDGVRIHPGNTSADTEGCVLVGKVRDGSSVTLSRVAFDELYPKIEAAWERSEPIFIEIR